MHIGYGKSDQSKKGPDPQRWFQGYRYIGTVPKYGLLESRVEPGPIFHHGGKAWSPGYVHGHFSLLLGA